MKMILTGLGRLEICPDDKQSDDQTTNILEK